MKLSVVLGAPPCSIPLLASMKSVLKKDEPGHVPGKPLTRQPLDDIRIAVEVDSADQGNVPHQTAAHGPVGQPAEAQRRRPLGLRGSIRGAVAPMAERIRGADPETEEPFESPMDGRSLRWKEEEQALCPIAIREWHANNVDDMMMLECVPHGAVGRGIQSMVGEVPRCAQETGSLRALARARSHESLGC